MLHKLCYYKANINNNNEKKTNYIGMTQGKFKDRYTQHTLIQKPI